MFKKWIYPVFIGLVGAIIFWTVFILSGFATSWIVNMLGALLGCIVSSFLIFLPFKATNWFIEKCMNTIEIEDPSLNAEKKARRVKNLFILLPAALFFAVLFMEFK